jgi:hypothetical protein
MGANDADVCLGSICKASQTAVKGCKNGLETTFKIPLFPSASQSFPSAPALKGNGKYQIHFILEGSHGMVIENDLVVLSDFDLRSETDGPIEVRVLVIPDFIIGGVQMNFLNFDQFGKHTLSPPGNIYIFLLIPLFGIRPNEFTLPSDFRR